MQFKEQIVFPTNRSQPASGFELRIFLVIQCKYVLLVKHSDTGAKQSGIKNGETKWSQ